MSRSDAPLILRVAGLATHRVQPLSSPICGQAIEDLRALELDLATKRQEMVDALHGLIPTADPDERRALLKIKRDCFNNRNLAKHVESPVFHMVPADLAQDILQIEEDLQGKTTELGRVFVEEEARQVGHLLELAQDPELGRGIGLSSSLVYENLHRVRPGSLQDQDKKARKMAVSLLRYATRAGYKCSPFSTLTRVAYGTVSGSADQGPGIHLDECKWSPRSEVSASFRFGQYWDLLTRIPAFRAGLEIHLNNTLEQTAQDQFRYLRPGRWDFTDGELRFFLESVSALRLSGPLIRSILDSLSDGTRPYQAWIEQLEQAEIVPAADVQRVVNQLLGLGVLELATPFTSLETRKITRLLEYAHTLPDREALKDVIDAMADFVAAGRSLEQRDRPWLASVKVEESLNHLWQQICRTVDPELPARAEDAGEIKLYEDVFLESKQESDDAGHRGIGRLPRTTADRILHSAEPLHRFAYGLSRRFEMLHTIDAFARDRRPGQDEIDLLDLFKEIRPLWQSYSKAIPRYPRGVPEKPFNPLQLDVIDSLHQVQLQVWKEVAQESSRVDESRSDAVGESPDPCHRLSPDRLSEILQLIPEAYRPIGGNCMFLQQATPDGRLWVMNRMFEGTGRYSSRFTQVMGPGAIEHHRKHFAECSVLDVDGEPVELLDLLRVQGNPLNIHEVHTPRVLDLPGETLELTDEQRVVFSRLKIRIGRPDRLPILVDHRGRRLLPVHMGHVNHNFLPPMLKLLVLFGPSGLEFQWPYAAPGERDDVLHNRRLEVGDIVVRRQRWWVRGEALRSLLKGLSDVDALVALDLFRRSHGMPDRVFLIETIQKATGAFYKPQYFDFSSPVFLHLLKGSIKSHGGKRYIGIEEMLPAPEAFPADTNGASWATEMQLDSLAIWDEGMDSRSEKRLHSGVIPVRI